MTKMVDNWIDSIVERSLAKVLDKALVISQMKNNFVTSMNSINQMSKTIINLAQMVQTHHQAIVEMSAVQAHILNKLRGSGTDMTFPEIKTEKDERSNLCFKLYTHGLKNIGSYCC